MSYSCNACGRLITGGDCGCYKPTDPVCEHGFIEGCCDKCKVEDNYCYIQPTHRCSVCGAYWKEWRDSWSLVSDKCEPCCDNVAMGQQIIKLDIYDERVKELELQVVGLENMLKATGLQRIAELEAERDRQYDQNVEQIKAMALLEAEIERLRNVIDQMDPIN